MNKKRLAILGFIWGACTPQPQSEPSQSPEEVSHEDSVQVRASVRIGSAQVTEVSHGERVFQAGDCTVWRFTDKEGSHYLAEGRELTKGEQTSCSMGR